MKYTLANGEEVTTYDNEGEYTDAIMDIVLHNTHSILETTVDKTGPTTVCL
jgi:hypothetical protein